ncbi:MAG: type II toxin-antitoxin system HicB family antitoxin [Acidimicrobiales bacterium]
MATWRVVYEHGPTSWGAYVPALPGLGVAGETRAEVEQLIREAIPFHLQGLVEEGLPIPDPNSVEAETLAI